MQYSKGDVTTTRAGSYVVIIGDMKGWFLDWLPEEEVERRQIEGNV